jgi:plastocyanin
MSDLHTEPEQHEAPGEHRPAPRQSLLVPVLIVVGLLALVAAILWTFSRVLLQVEPHVATATALLVAISIVVILSFAASRKRVTNGSLLMVAVGVVGAGMLFSGIALIVGQSSEEGGAPGATIAVAAPEGAATSGFDQKALTAPADVGFTIAFNNQDPGVQHNIVIATGDPVKDPSAQQLFVGDLTTGPIQFDYEVSPIQAGKYVFYCEVHPTTMNGTFTVAAGAPAGGNTETGQVIAAQNISFDIDTLTFPADTPSTLTFQNNDAGTQHNVAIYTDESLSKALFQGEVITGVASVVYQLPPMPEGTYYFHCDIHPNMHGSVTVGTTGGKSGGGGGGGSPPPVSPSETASASGAPPPSGGATVTAQNLAFSPTEISLPAGEPSTITFDNQDAGVPHNIDIFSDAGYTTSVFKGDLVTGVATQTYDVPALDAGTYYFHCDVHTTMTGTVTVG